MLSNGNIGLKPLMESTWEQFKEGLPVRLGPSTYENFDGVLAKI